jgi:CHAT domain-containing protein
MVFAACLMVTGSVPPEPVIFKKRKLELQITDARAQFAKGRFVASLRDFQTALATAQRNGDIEWSIKLQSNIGGTYYSLNRYREAIQEFLAARKLARNNGRQTLAAVIDVNLASLYILIGDLDAANRSAEAALRTAGTSDLQGYRYQLLACVAELRAKQGRRTEAVHYFLDAAFSADQAADRASSARIWEHLGEYMLRQGNLRAAEGPLLEAYRLRTLFHDRDLRVSFLNVAWLRIEQGDLRSGSVLLQRAEAMPSTDTGAPSWFVSFVRGRLAQKSGVLQTALHCYTDAFEKALQWQQEVGPSDSQRGVSFAREEFKTVYEALMDASLASDRGQAVDAFEATERYRAAALEQTLLTSRRWMNDMPPEYWSLLNRLRSAEIAELTKHSKANIALISQLHNNLTDLQSEHNSISVKTFEKSRPGETLRSIQASIRPGEVLLSFYSGSSSTVLWAVTKQQIRRYALPSTASLDSMATQFRADVENRRPSAVALPLYQALFHKLDPRFQSARTWIVSAVDAIFSIPFVALEVDRNAGGPVYLLERHVVLHTPSAVMLTYLATPPRNTRFVGVGDGIYNSADTRWHATSAACLRPLSFLKKRNARLLQLPRLSGSGPEIDACASKWAGLERPLLLKGRDASTGSLETALQLHPAVLHMAAHVISPSSDRPEESAIALGINSDGVPDVLTSDDIAALDATETTVVMSGCSSANGPAVSGKGVLGLTRAWLLAGAQVVVGSRWPTPDDTGELFQSFYRHFRNRQDDADRTRAVARSLNEAQNDMLRSRTWRSSPWYWGAFYALGKE